SRTVKAALEHSNASALSNRQVAEHCGVSEGTVRNYRKESTAQITQSEQTASPETPALRVRTGRDGRKINTAKIGKSKAQALDEQADILKRTDLPEESRAGVGMLKANQAIDCLSRIPKNDRQREQGFRFVIDWIKKESAQKTKLIRRVVV